MSLTTVAVIYVFICVASIAPIFITNGHLFRMEGGRKTSAIEVLLLLIGVAALLIGWYHNLAYFREYTDVAGWWHWTTLLFVNPASASAGQDLIFANLLLFPLWNMIDGRRHQMKIWWWYFPMSLLTSYAFGIALFMVMLLRQMKFNERANPKAAG